MTDQALVDITGFSIVTAGLERLVRFYREILGFAVQGKEERIGGAEMARLGLSRSGPRQFLTLAQQTLSRRRSLCRRTMLRQRASSGKGGRRSWFATRTNTSSRSKHRSNRYDARCISVAGPRAAPGRTGHGIL